MTASVAELMIPRKAWDHYEKAYAAVRSGKPEAFGREASLALQIAPTFADVYVLRAATQNDAHQYEAAIESIRAARAIRPDVAWSAEVLAGSLNGLKRFDDAVAALGRPDAFEAERWQWKFERTRAELGRQDVEAALHWSELALESMPSGCTDARLLRANALQMAGRPVEAIGQLEAYLAPGDKLTYRAQVVEVLGRLRALVSEGRGEMVAAK